MSSDGTSAAFISRRRARKDGRITKVAQYASPLRAGTERLLQAFAEARTDMGRADRHVVTMTGELADTFSSRQEGVERLAMLAAQELGGVSIYAGPAGCVSPPEAPARSADVASANWHACATLIARQRDNALFIDLGSTTTDIVPIVDGKVAARGYTDAQRLAAGELVYTGLVRGFVMATANRAPLRGTWTPLVNENFATMADVHRILGTLPPDVDLMATADGREKTIAASRARLARMLGADAADADEGTWTLVARWFAESQTARHRRCGNARIVKRSLEAAPAHYCGRHRAFRHCGSRAPIGLPLRHVRRIT